MRLCTIFLLCALHLVAGQNYKSENDITSQLIKFIRKTQSHIDKEEFSKIIEILSFPKYIYRAPLSSYTTGRQKLSCTLCRSTVKSIMKLHEEGRTEAEIIDVVTDLCVLLEIQTEKVCRGVVELNTPIILYIIDHEPRFTPETFCGVSLQTREKDSCPFNDPRFEWSVNIPTRNLSRENKATSKATSFKVAHISDVHYDPAYEPYGLAECDEPTCCRIGQKKKKSPRWRSLYDDSSSEDRVHVGKDGLMYVDLEYEREIRELKEREARAQKVDQQQEGDRAGYWGDYRDCDTPWWAFEDGVDYIRDTHQDIDYVYYTGDSIDHGVWETSEAMITESHIKTLDKFKATFAFIPIFPVIGNHESQPMNQYAPPSVTEPRFSTSWLYELLVEKWGVWLPSETFSSIRVGGYYSVLVRPGFRVVALNNNLCYIYNWWVHLEPNDPSGQLEWLVATLYEAERMGEKVHILAHIPAGTSDCFYTYTREYQRIVERFSDTITAEFNGHTHNDEFKIFYEKANLSNPISVAWNGGSLTPYSYVNPNYRIFDIDSETYDVVDFETWIYNLTEANLTPDQRPRWFKEYSFKEFYGLSSLQPTAMDDLVHRMVSAEKQLTQKYHTLRIKSADESVCNNNCIKKNLCYMTRSVLYDERKCEGLWKQFNSTSVDLP